MPKDLCICMCTEKWTLDETIALRSVRGHHRKGLHTRAGGGGEPETMVSLISNLGNAK